MALTLLDGHSGLFVSFVFLPNLTMRGVDQDVPLGGTDPVSQP